MVKGKEAIKKLQKYSPEVLLSGGKPIECLEEKQMKFDEVELAEFKA